MASKLREFILAINKTKKVVPFKGRLLGLDPGGTTGYFFITCGDEGIVFSKAGQVSTGDERECAIALAKLFTELKPTHVVFESYHIYDWKSDQHKWSPVWTVQVIGCIWTLCEQLGITYSQQSAQNAKGFWTDEKLHEFHMYEKGMRHGRDATRHALHYLCFGPPNT
jgi:hypothetical protein